MDMESTTGSDHSSVAVIRRKRSNRKRPSSPFCAAAFNAAEITSGYSSGAGDAGSCSNCLVIDQHYSPPSISSDLSETTKEEYELVECLMLLAKGICPMDELRKIRQQRKRTQNNVTSRRFAAARIDGYDVHECKICYRTFPSGQALGGHQSSHKKRPKFAPEETSLALLPPLLVNADDEAQIDTKLILALVPLQMFSGNGTVKLYECTICGEKFLTGQALGGHMGRHRTTKTRRPAMENSSGFFAPRSEIIRNKSDSSEEVENGSQGLLLDLNLPPPEFGHLEDNCELSLV